MIKSSDTNFDNTYRILKVLSNQDYLAIDQQLHKYIFCQSKTMNQSSLPKACNKNPQQKNTRLLHHKEIIVVNDSSYYVFELENETMMPARDIPVNKLESSKFVRRLVRDAVTKLLGQFIWLQPRKATKILDIRNLWLNNNYLNVLMMPRGNKKTLSIKRTEEKRAKSQQGSFLGRIMKKQTKIISQFGKLLLEVLHPPILQNKNLMNINSDLEKILTQMVNRNISYEEIVTQIKGMQSQNTSTKISRSIHLRYHETKQLSSRRYTVDPSTFSTNSFNRNKKERLVTPPKNKCRTQGVTDMEKASSSKGPSVQKRRLWGSGGSKFKKRWYLNFSTKSKSVCELTYQENEKYKSKFSTIDVCTGDQKKYLTWMRGKKNQNLNINQIIMTRNQKARQKFNELQTKTHSSVENNQKNLKERLYSKALRFKFKKPEPNKEELSCEIAPLLVDNQKNKEKHETVFEKKQIRKGDGPKILKEDEETKLSHNLFENIRPQFLEQQTIQQLTFCNITNKIQEQPSTTHQQTFNQLINQQQSMNISNVPKQKMKRIKNQPVKQTIFQDEDEIETITLAKDIKKQNEHTEVKEPVQQKTDQLNQKTPTIENREPTLNHQFEQLKESSRSVRFKGASEAVREFITLINILGDICVRIVSNKNHLLQFSWRKTVYFLYQRFQYQRTRLLKNLQSNSKGIVRQHAQIDPQSLVYWHQSKEKNLFVEQITKENANINTTYNQFTKKTLAECTLQPMICNFIKNRSLILGTQFNKNRLWVSKYAVALIINEYDEAIEKKTDSKEALDYIWRSLFGLRIFAQLDGIYHQSSKDIAKEYESQKKFWEKEQKWVERVYEMYYPEGEDKVQC